MKIFRTLGLIASLTLSLNAHAALTKGFPEHWGEPPAIQTSDLRKLPDGYGMGSSTLAKWIQENLDKDAAKASPQPEGKEVPLFDGKTLEGFTVRSGSATYEVKDGEIIGTTAKRSPNTFLCTDQEFGDFELEFDVMLVNARLNSGVQIRSKLKGEKFGGTVYGPQVEIEDGGTKGGEAGYIYGEKLPGGWITPKRQLIPHTHFKSGEWNHFRIVANGPRIQTWVNGEMISDLTDEELYKSHAKGLIGFQVHGVGNSGPFQVKWKNLKLKEL